jgi:hypothetical protein
LPVPAQIRVAPRALVDDAQKPGRSAAVLHVGQPVSGRRLDKNPSRAAMKPASHHQAAGLAK